MRHKLNLGYMMLVVIAILVATLLFWNQGSQTSAWIYPYFSGAANLGFDLTWKIDAVAYSEFAQLSYAEQVEYKFVRGQPGDLASYAILDRGYMFIVWFAQVLFFWLPSIKAVVWFQVVFHIISVLWILWLLKTKKQKLIFFFAYAINPLVIHFVTFAYHYYWQILPALLWISYEAGYLRPLGRKIYWILVIMGMVFLIRQSTLLLLLFILSYWVWKERSIHTWIALSVMLVFALTFKNPSQPWHTAYIGLGAYSNEAGIMLSDDSGFELFETKTGVKIDTTPPNGNYYNDINRSVYYDILRKEYIKYVTQHPGDVVRNALTNLAQSFSFGYVTKSIKFSYLSALLGTLVALLMIWRGMYLRMALLLMGVLGFVVYFPPIPAYMFGNYLLLAWIFVHITDPWLVGLMRFLKGDSMWRKD